MPSYTIYDFIAEWKVQRLTADHQPLQQCGNIIQQGYTRLLFRLAGVCCRHVASGPSDAPLFCHRGHNNIVKCTYTRFHSPPYNEHNIHDCEKGLQTLGPARRPIRPAGYSFLLNVSVKRLATFKQLGRSAPNDSNSHLPIPYTAV